MPEATGRFIDKNDISIPATWVQRTRRALRITGRMKDMIIRAARISIPGKLRSFCAHRGDQGCSGRGIRAPGTGKRSRFIILKDGASLTEEEVGRFLPGADFAIQDSEIRLLCR